MSEVNSFTGKYSFLSNFYPVELITKEGLLAHSVEHAYQAAKMLRGVDRIKVLMAPSPAAAKRAGNALQMRADWPQLKDVVMYEYVRLKFLLPPLKLMLIATDDMKLIEGNTWGDQYWGAIWTPSGWQGKNRLGEILMQVRAECASS